MLFKLHSGSSSFIRGNKGWLLLHFLLNLVRGIDIIQPLLFKGLNLFKGFNNLKVVGMTSFNETILQQPVHSTVKICRVDHLSLEITDLILHGLVLLKLDSNFGLFDFLFKLLVLDLLLGSSPFCIS